MVGWHHQLNGLEFEQTPGDGEGQGSLVCCSPRGHRVGHGLATERKQRYPTYCMYLYLRIVYCFSGIPISMGVPYLLGNPNWKLTRKALRGQKVKVKLRSLSHVRLFAMNCSLLGSSALGFSSQEYWGGLPFPSPEDLPDPQIEPGSPAL